MKQRIMTYFQAPITNKVPGAVCNLQGLHDFITTDSSLRRCTLQVRAELPDVKRFRAAKQQMLPYVTPGGVFSYCNRRGLLFPSGTFVIDIDHLASPEEAAYWRDTLFADCRLQPELAFVSPGGTGVKLFQPYRTDWGHPLEEGFAHAMHTAWQYLTVTYKLEADKANADISRACFLCHDADAKMR